VKAAIVFPGQGSQGPAMGREWAGHPAWELAERASLALGRDLAALLLREDTAPADTLDVQLCVFVVSMMAWEVLRPALRAPAVFAGHSFGQISALTAAGVLTFDEGLRLAARRGEVTAAASARQPGGMLAVLGLDNAKAAWVCSAAPARCWLANDNAPGQFVVAGAEDSLEPVVARARRLGARKIVRLQVDGAFHTPLMVPAADRFAAYLSAVRFKPGAGPVVSNGDARTVTVPRTWAARLADHLITPVRWRSVQLELARLGAEQLFEVGFGTTLTSLAKRTVPRLRRWNVDSPAAVRELQAAPTAGGGA
jgi:[acyl-carrier-protein] S-malonyltransferase